MKKNLKIWFLILFLIALDLLSKQIFYNLKIGQELPFLHPVFNTGISRWMTIPFRFIMILSFLGIIFFIFAYKKRRISDWIVIFLFAGTLGNLIDRIVFWGVRDFISIGSFPVFNLADSFLTIAVILLILWEKFSLQSSQKKIH